MCLADLGLWEQISNEINALTRPLLATPASGDLTYLFGIIIKLQYRNVKVITFESCISEGLEKVSINYIVLHIYVAYFEWQNFGIFA